MLLSDGTVSRHAYNSEEWYKAQIAEQEKIASNCRFEMFILKNGGTGDATAESIRRRLDLGLIDEYCEPTKCTCGSTNFKDRATDHVDYLLVEKDRFCLDCGELLGCWSYGHWLP